MENIEIDSLIERFKGEDDSEIKHDDLSKCKQEASSLSDSGDFEGAIKWYLRASSLSPEDKIVNFNLSTLFHIMELPLLAIHFIERLLVVNPEDMTAQSFLWALAHTNEECRACATAAYRRLAEKDVRAAHKLAALTGTGVLSGRGDPEYARKIYDDMADSFETKLVDHLHYRGPWLLHDMLLTALNSQEKNMMLLPSYGDWRVLDLGCGSGLCGRIFSDAVGRRNNDERLEEFSGASRQEVNGIGSAEADQLGWREEKLNASGPLMIGVDISSKIARIALKNGGYDMVICADILEALTKLEEHIDQYHQQQQQQFRRLDLILAADTFIYVGALNAAFAAIRKVLLVGGYFAFSVEELEEESASPVIEEADLSMEPPGACPGFGCRLQPSSARFAHAHIYIQWLAERHGFEVVEMRRLPLRYEGSVPIPGIFYLLKQC